MSVQFPLFGRLTPPALPAACLAMLWLTGCGPSASKPAPAPSASVAKDDHGHSHDHPTEGPHHGDLVELGNEEYHAEIVHGDTGTVTIYVLDRNAKQAVPIEAAEVVINLSHDGKAEQFKLPAAPEATDPQGKSSRFTLENADLAKDLDAEGRAAKLVITIEGKSYTGKIEHKHEHGKGGHAH